MVKLSSFEMKRTRRGYTATRRQHEEMLDVEIIMDEYDNLHPDGKYVQAGKPPRLKIREMYHYCKKHGINPEDLTDEQREKFRY